MLRGCFQRFSIISHIYSGGSSKVLARNGPLQNYLLKIQSRFIILAPDLKTMRLDSSEFRGIFTPEMNALIELFKRHNYELRIAGGAVRDLVLSKIPQDIDFATVATPAMMKEMFELEGIRMLNNKGEKHGTITCRINDKENFEVTTLRIDVVTDGRHAEVEFTQDWVEDARRRDLTINSMFLGFDGTVYDYFNGLEDLENKQVRFVGDATSRIQEDYLRILRYFRFYGRISPNADQHEKETLEAIRSNKGGLAGIAGERIFVELKKIVTGNHADKLLITMSELGLFPFLGLPEKSNLEELSLVYERCKHLEPSHMTILTALLDSLDEVEVLQKRIKMSNDEFRTATFLVEHRHDEFTEDTLQYCKDLLCFTIAKEPKSKQRIMELLKYTGREEVMEEFASWQLPKFPINGHTLIELGIPKGPAMAQTMNALKSRWQKSGFKLTEEELLKMIDEIKKKYDSF